MEHKRNFYEILKITRSASEEEIKCAFTQELKRIKCQTNSSEQTELKKELKTLKKAYKVLQNPESKWVYDNITLQVQEIQTSFLKFEKFLENYEASENCLEEYSRKTGTEEGIKMLEDPNCFCSRCMQVCRKRLLKSNKKKKTTRFCRRL